MTSATVAEIDRLDAAVRADQTNADLHRQLGSALLQRIRETADPSLYGAAAGAFERARALAPDDPLVLVGIATLQLGKHRFADALETARQSISVTSVQAPAASQQAPSVPHAPRVSPCPRWVTSARSLMVMLWKSPGSSGGIWQMVTRPLAPVP